MSLDKHAAERRRFARLLGTDGDHGSGLPIGGEGADSEERDRDADDGDGDADGSSDDAATKSRDC